eukprot:1574855-Rhodomonas_salina.2
MKSPGLPQRVMIPSSYALATACPVLTWSTLLPSAYARSGIDVGYAATRRILGEEKVRTLLERSKVCSPLSAYALATPCPNARYPPMHLLRDRLGCPIVTS